MPRARLLFLLWEGIMRALRLSVLCFTVAVAGTPLLRAADDPKAILDKAIQAHGGKDVLNRKAEVMTTKGTVSLNGITAPVTVHTYVLLPDKFKNVMKFSLGGEEHTVVQVLNGDKAWTSRDGQLMEVGEKVRAEMDETKYADQVARLVPLVEDKTFQLTALGESKVNDKTVVGVKVQSKGHRDIELYFDKDTGLLAKTKRMSLNGQMNAVTQEEVWSAYLKKDGIQRPTKYAAYQDGKKFSEGEITDVQYPDTIDEKEFAKP
jgi:hypothetical protein